MIKKRWRQGCLVIWSWGWFRIPIGYAMPKDLPDFLVKGREHELED
jgi:hypothetical protein